VGDVDDRQSLLPETLEQREEGGGLLISQRGCRLVEDQDHRLAAQRPGDLDLLALGDAQLAHRPGEVRRDAQFAEEPPRVGSHPPPVHQPLRSGQVAREEVLQAAQTREQADVLMNHRDSQTSGGVGIEVRDRAARQADLAFIRCIQPRQDLDQRGLARPVLADQRVNLPGAHVQAHVAERLDAGEGLAEARDLENGGQCDTPVPRATVDSECREPVRCSPRGALRGRAPSRRGESHRHPARNR